MRVFLGSVGILAGLLLVVVPLVRSQQAANGARAVAAQPADRSADESAIKANIEAFVKAFNASDAKTIATLFTPDAVIVDKEGDATEGRAEIEKTFAGIFKEAPKKQIEVHVESIRFVGADIAMEQGTTKEIYAPGEPPEYDRYTVLHVKREGKWLMALARDEEGETPTGHEQLRPLGWLVGEWVDDGGNVVVRSTCNWSPDGNYLLQEFKLQVAGKEAMQVSQRIGWDPLARRIRSWVFDSDGGFGESIWVRDGDNWFIKATGVRPDGKPASATNMLVPAGKDGYVWRSTDRIVGEEVVGPMEVKVVRKPPQPGK